MPLVKFVQQRQRSYWIAQSTKRFGIFSQYEIKNEMGRGPNSIVYQCQRKGLTDMYSVKCMRKNLAKKVSLVDAGILLKLDHKNLARLQEIFETRTKIYVVQELLTGENLLERVANLEVSTYNELLITKLVRDIVLGIKYLHFCGVYLGNLKPENLIFNSTSDDAHVKITDFVMSTIVEQEVLLASITRQPYYTAPEILKNIKADLISDMWSLGTIAYILLFGVEPFYHDDPMALYKKIIKGQYEFPPHDQDDLSAGAKEFLRKLLLVDVQKRMTSEMAYLNYWVNSINVKTRPLTEVLMRMKELNTARKNRARLLPITISFSGATSINEGYLYLVEDVNKTETTDNVPPNSFDSTNDNVHVDVSREVKDSEDAEALKNKESFLDTKEKYGDTLSPV
ncbi:myosin light chain kinase A-like isoform X1 [Biomphalaria glabrata]|nr:myosin light chain kinase A-like isoform X1 [Biomphalaria glabrata]